MRPARKCQSVPYDQRYAIAIVSCDSSFMPRSVEDAPPRYRILSVHQYDLSEVAADSEADRLNAEFLAAGRLSQWAVVYPPGGLDDHIHRLRVVG